MQIFQIWIYKAAFVVLNIYVLDHAQGKLTPNNACTGRLGLCAFFELVLSYGGFPFPNLSPPSRR